MNNSRKVPLKKPVKRQKMDSPPKITKAPRRSSTLTRIRRKRKNGSLIKPRKLVFSTKAWIRSKSSSAASFRRRFKKLVQEEAVHYDEAKGLDPPVHENFRARTVVSPPAFAAVIKNGRVWGRNGVVITPDNRVLCDISWEYYHSFLVSKRHSISRHWKPYPVKKLNGTVGHVAHISSNNYFHWLFDVLPRIGLLRQSGQEIDKFIFRGGDRHAYMDETLNMMGISPDQRVYTTGRFHVKAEKLVVPSLTSRYTWKGNYPRPVRYSKWACDFVRHELMASQKTAYTSLGKCLYISRSRAGRRRLVNEDEIIAMLDTMGFTVVEPETMRVKDQIALFASAKTIIAPHGAGLANLAFCAPGTKVVELFSPKYAPGYYWLLSNNFGLDYYYLIGERLPNQKGWVGNRDFYVNPELLLRLMDMVDKDE